MCQRSGTRKKKRVKNEIRNLKLDSIKLIYLLLFNLFTLQLLLVLSCGSLLVDVDFITAMTLRSHRPFLLIQSVLPANGQHLRHEFANCIDPILLPPYYFIKSRAILLRSLKHIKHNLQLYYEVYAGNWTIAKPRHRRMNGQ